MAIIQARSNRKPSGGALKSTLAKRKHMTGRLPTLTKLGATKRKLLLTKGGGVKTRVLHAEVANVIDPKTKKASQVKIKTVVESPANRYYSRRNIMTKGTIIETEQGKARVTSRPGQDGTVNAVLLT